MNKNVFVVVDSIDVNDSSGSKANVAFINNLVHLGYHVLVYHYTRKPIEIQNATCTSIREKKDNGLYVLSRIQRVLQRVLKINLAKYLEPLFGFSFTFYNDVNSIKAELKKLDVSKVDLVLTLSKAASFRPHYAVNQIPQFYNKWMAYVHDPYPFSKYPKPYDWKEQGYKIKERFFRELSYNARYSAFPSLLLKEWMGSFFENFNKTGIVIPHQIINLDLEGFRPKINFESDKFNILHAGSLLKQRNPENLILGYQLFLENNVQAKENSKLILLGSADYHKGMIEDYAKSIPQLQINLFNIPFKDVLWLQSKMSVNVILEADAKISPFLPGKLPHCVSANKPIIHLGPEKSETKRLLGDKYAYSAEVNDVNKISEILGQLYNIWTNNKDGLLLDRLDLINYLGEEYFKKQIETVLSND